MRIVKGSSVSRLFPRQIGGGGLPALRADPIPGVPPARLAGSAASYKRFPRVSNAKVNRSGERSEILDRGEIVATPRDIIIQFVDEYLASNQTEIDMDLLEARIHLGGTLNRFTEDELAIGINQVIGHYRRAFGQEQGKVIERLIDNIFIEEH